METIFTSVDPALCVDVDPGGLLETLRHQGPQPKPPRGSRIVSLMGWSASHCSPHLVWRTPPAHMEATPRSG